MFCTNCGERLEKGFQSCPVCGQKIERRQETREGTAGHQEDGRNLQISYYDPSTKELIEVKDGIVTCKVKNKRIGWAPINEVVLLYFCKKSKYAGLTELVLLLPGKKSSNVYLAVREKSEELEQFYLSILPYCKHNFQKSYRKAAYYVSKEKRNDICPYCGSRVIQYEKLPDISTTASYFKGVYVTTHEEGKMQARCEECGKKWKF